MSSQFSPHYVYLGPNSMDPKAQTFRSTSGGSILGGGKNLVLPNSTYYPSHLVPSPVPVTYTRTQYGIVSSAYSQIPPPTTSNPNQTQLARSFTGAFHSTAPINPYSKPQPQTFGQIQTQRQQPKLSASQPLTTDRAPHPAATNSAYGTTHLIPGYSGHVPSSQFRFGQSYGRITAAVLAEYPGGHRPNTLGATTTRY